MVTHTDEFAFVSSRWKSFLDCCCVKEKNAYIAVHDLQSLFAYFISKHDVSNTYKSQYIQLASKYIPTIISDEKDLELSPGWECNDWYTTRLVLGLKVVRLRHDVP